MIYMDHAATTPVKNAVLQAMLPFFTTQYANASSGYQSARTCRRAVDMARGQVAALIGAQPSEIYFTSGGSESDNWAITGMASAAGTKCGIVTSSIEHHAVLNTCAALSNHGYEITYLPVDANGVINMRAAESSINSNTALVSLMLANNEVGSIQPVAQICEIAHRFGVPVHTDAVQAVGHIPVSVDKLGVDLLSLSAHKFYGPKGVGALYIRKGTRIDRLIHGGEQEKGMRAGTENTAAIVGMGAAAAIALESLTQVQAQISALRDYMIRRAMQILPNVRINALCVDRLPGHVHMTISHADASLILMQLDMQGIAASSGSACASGATTRSHVLTAMGNAIVNEADLRFTLGECNTKEEIDKTLDALKCIVQE